MPGGPPGGGVAPGGGITVRLKLVLAVAPPASVTVTAMVALPCSPAAGKINIDRVAPFPSTTRFPCETNRWLEERTSTFRLETGVSMSLIVNENGPAGRSTSVD